MRPTQSRKGVKGQLPLAESRDSVPCGVWGNAPTVLRATIIANALNKGAGSEASLPVTLRVRRRAPKLLFPQDSVKNRINRRIPHAAVFLHCMGDCFLADYLPSVDSSSLRTAPSTYTYTLPLAFSPLMVTVYLPGVFGTMLKLLVGSRLPV